MKVINITKTYEDVSVLNNISIEFNKCGIYLIHGESGAGKTTLFRIINNLETPDSGSIELENEETISYCSSSNQLIEHITVMDMIKIISNDLTIINDMLKSFGIYSLRNKKIKKLSSGERERLQIILTLLKDSRVVFLDEPTENLDKKTSIQIFNYLKSLSKEKIIVLISHDYEISSKYADEIYLLENGSLIEEKKDNNNLVARNFKQNDLKKKGLFNYSFKNLFKHPIILPFNLLLIFMIYFLTCIVLMNLCIDSKNIYKEIGNNLKYPLQKIICTREEAEKYHLLISNTFVEDGIEFEDVADYIDINDKNNVFAETYSPQMLEKFETTKIDNVDTIIAPCFVYKNYKYNGKKVDLGNYIDSFHTDLSENIKFVVVGLIDKPLTSIGAEIIYSAKLHKYIYDTKGIMCNLRYTMYKIFDKNVSNTDSTFNNRIYSMDYVSNISDIKDYCISFNHIQNDYTGWFYYGTFPNSDDEIMLGNPYLYASLNEDNNKDLKLNIYGETAGINNVISKPVYEDILGTSINKLKITGTIGYCINGEIINNKYDSFFVSDEMYQKIDNSIVNNNYHRYLSGAYYLTKESYNYVTREFFDVWDEHLSIGVDRNLSGIVLFSSLSLIMILIESIFIKVLLDDTIRDYDVLRLYNAKDKDIKFAIFSNYILKTIIRILGLCLGIPVGIIYVSSAYSTVANINMPFKYYILIPSIILFLGLSYFYDVLCYKLRRKKVILKHE